MPVYVQEFEVEGKGYFPLDMLRYDNCFPRFEESSAEIANTFLNWSTEIRTVTLSRFITFKGNAPTFKRWESFGWRVTSVELPRKL